MIFEFYVDDDTTSEEIEHKVNDVMELSMNYEVEEGYEAVQEIVYKKKQ